MDNLDALLGGENADTGHGEKLLRTLGSLEHRQNELKEQLAQSMQEPRESNPDADKKTLCMANELASKTRQIDYLERQVERNLTSNTASGIIHKAAAMAADTAQEAETVISSWGDDEGTPEANEVNTSLLSRIKNSQKLKGIVKQLGRMTEIFQAAKRNAFAYGRGDKYDIQLGGDYSRALTSEYALLAHPTTAVLFALKAMRKKLKQYRKRERIAKGEGDFIVCIDTSGSMRGSRDDWSKALALTIMSLAAAKNRRFALINFSTSIQTSVFIPGQYSTDDVFTALEVFQGGGTDFEQPLKKAMELMATSDFERADILFITDGECSLAKSFEEKLLEQKGHTRFTITGIVIDDDSPGQAFSLEPFCDQIYRMSELAADAIVSSVLGARI